MHRDSRPTICYASAKQVNKTRLFAFVDLVEIRRRRDSFKRRRTSFIYETRSREIERPNAGVQLRRAISINAERKKLRKTMLALCSCMALFGSPLARTISSQIQKPATMHYCRDCDALFFNAIDDSIAVREPLANVFIGHFRNYATRAREM
jgi:hypothetical protein